MDTSELYIKMCEKATEIQEQWIPAEGDFIAFITVVNPPQIFVNYLGKSWAGITKLKHDTKDKESYGEYKILLPRQDQLQDMIIDMFSDFESKFRGMKISFEDFYRENKGTLKKFETFEKLWLYFVMAKIYKKVWDSTKEDWVAA